MWGWGTPEPGYGQRWDLHSRRPHSRGFLLAWLGWLGRLAGRTLTRLIRRPLAVWVFGLLVLIFNLGPFYVKGPVTFVPVFTGTIG